MPITVTHAKSNIIADWTGTVTVGNSSGGTATMQASDLVRPQDWNSNHAITMNLTGSEIASLFNIGNGLSSSTNASGVSIGMSEFSFFEPFPLLAGNTTLDAGINSGSWYLTPVFFPSVIQKGVFRVLQTHGSANFLNGVVASAASTGQATKSAVFGNRFALYTRGTGTNSTQIELAWAQNADISATQSITFSSTATNDVRVTNAVTVALMSQFGVDGNFTTGSASTSGSLAVAASTMASTAPNSLITGGLPAQLITGSYVLQIPMTTTLPPGQYWLGHMFTHSSATGTTGGGNYGAGTMFNVAFARMQLLDYAGASSYRQFGGSATVGNTSTNIVPFAGAWTGALSSAPANFAASDIRQRVGRLYFNYVRTTA